MMTDRALRAGTSLAVLLVACIAAAVSYIHIEHLAMTHGQAALAAVLLPISIDGTVAAASLVMLRAARAGLRTPWLARLMLGLSVVATLAANIDYGARYGLTGSLLSGWPAVAFIGSAEMAIGMVRRTRQAAPDQPSDAGPVPAVPEVATTVHEAAKVAYAASVRGGNPLSTRALERRFGISRNQATKVIRELVAESNGQHPPET